MILDVKNLTKSYLLDKEILSRLSFTVEPGDIHIIYGRSGSGKTTFLNCLSGVTVPESGQLDILGTDMMRLTEDERADFRLQHIGILYQFFNLLPSLTIRENIQLPAQLLGIERTSFLADLAHQFGISDILSKTPDQCSGGECQRAALCRALICKPSLILADEPTGNLDTRSRDLVLSYLRHLASEKKMGMVIASHDEALMQMADVVWYLDNGQLRRDDVTAT